MVIEKFVPPEFKKSELDLKKLNELTGKNWQYASSGASCLFHILKSLNCVGKILVPVFTCTRVLIPIRKLGLEPVFYDLDIKDLNSSPESITRLAENNRVKTVISASLFGNPADMIEIEDYCKSKEILLIDDNAQGFGSTLNGRWLGTFGNGGFFSFFPGKATAGHMGGFFWSDEKYILQYKRHNIIHLIRWLDFYYNRMKIYENKNHALKKIISILASQSNKHCNLDNDSMSEFEKEIVGGILNAIFNNEFGFRKQYHDQFINCFSKNPYFTPVKALRGEPNNHKLILIANSKEIAYRLNSYLKNAMVYCSPSYDPLCEDVTELDGMRMVQGRVIELPIENNSEKMNYLFDKLNNFKN